MSGTTIALIAITVPCGLCGLAAIGACLAAGRQRRLQAASARRQMTVREEVRARQAGYHEACHIPAEELAEFDYMRLRYPSLGKDVQKGTSA